jgi:acyl-CoA reductase-like NAD-dependent aldehyde dehydrogenase
MAIDAITERLTGKGESESFEVTNPADGSVIGTLPVDDPERVREVVARVRANQPAWEALGNKGRARRLGELRDWLLDNQDRIATTMQAETGKVRAEAASEVPYIVDLINFYGKKADKFIGEQRVTPHSPLMRTKRLRVQYRPYPVVGVISPWNFPLVLSLGDAIPALQAGAAVVIKPSEVTPLGLGELLEAWKREIGGPDVFDVVNGMGETGSALVDEADFIQFTGSDRTAKKVLARAAETLTPVSAELGGKDPMIVLKSADLEKAVNAATWGSFANSGQICISVERLYVEEPIYDEFVKRLTEEVGKLNQGMDDEHYGSEVGAMTFPPQTKIVEDHVEDARRSGATILTGGRRLEGRLVPAHVDRRRRPLDEGDGRRELRPRRRGDEGARRRRGGQARQRHPLRAERLGLRQDIRGRSGGAPARGRDRERQRRPRRVPRLGRADGRLEGLRDRLSPRRVRDQEVRPAGVAGDHPLRPEARGALLPVHREAPRAATPDRDLLQRPRLAPPARAVTGTRGTLPRTHRILNG